MQTFNQKKDFISHLYKLLMEANLNKDDAEVLADLKLNPDREIENSIAKIKRLKLQAKANLKRNQFNEAQTLISDFLQKAGDNISQVIDSLIGKKENEPLVAFFRKYENVSEEDKLSMLKDKQILEMIKKISQDTENKKDDKP
ncbi:MAG: hypothetical protein JSR71_06640 [Proteobacteria bacterium]|nr:hypothetical protein [Pseudomonadota bacterium]